MPEGRKVLNCKKISKKIAKKISKKISKKTRLLLVYLFAVFLLFLAFILLASAPPRGAFFSRVFDIPEGMSGEEIGQLLYENNLLRSKLFFKVNLRIKGSKLQAGEYILNNRMNLWRILKMLEEGRVRLHRLTIPEGFTLEEIAKLLARQELADPRRFLKLTRDKELLKRYAVPGKSLEGYLFPDTYKIPKGMKAGSLIEMILVRFGKVIDKDFRKKLENCFLPLHEVVILASLIEKEAVIDEEKSLISGVFYNRLARGMRLQSDPTVKYILPKSRKNLYYKDLEIDSPYNTYLRKGLPEGPICNPGKVSLEAALSPQDSEYLYFVSKNDGTHFFSRTYEEHLVAKKRYQK